jgi:hypothetical protein
MLNCVEGAMSRQGCSEARSYLASRPNGVTEFQVCPRNVECGARAERGRHLPGFLGYLDRLQLTQSNSAM